MTTLIQIFSVLLFFIAAIVLNNAVPKEFFSKQIQLYKEMDCTIIVGGKSKNVTEDNEEYDCSSFFERPKNSCFFEGKFYNPGQDLKSLELEKKCWSVCHCLKTETNLVRFNCDFDHCAFYTPAINETCELSFSKIGQCCPEISCTLDPKRSCVKDGKIYYDGQKFWFRCSTCLCKEGKIICSENKCLEEMKHTDKIDRKCAPVFSLEECCSVTWACYDDVSDEITNKSKSQNTTSMCHYGPKYLNAGDSLIKKFGNVSGFKCVCIIPPLLTCWKI